jgi:hypothetical protein
VADASPDPPAEREVQIAGRTDNLTVVTTGPALELAGQERVSHQITAGIDIGATPRSSLQGMASTPETGFLAIADLTGYTAYLSGSEIEHAPAIAGDLLETIVGRLEPPFRLTKFEGDAAFLFVEDGRAEGSLLLDAIEAA